MCQLSALESQYAAFESAGLVVIYSSDALAPEAKRKLSDLAPDTVLRSLKSQLSSAA